MIFNEFPYTDFHELNEDWIIARMKELLEKYRTLDNAQFELTNLINGLRSYINNYFDNLDVQEEINKKLDEMLEDGSLLAALTQVRAETSRELGWKIRKIGDSYMCTINKTETGITEAYLLSPDAPLNIPYCWYTNEISWMLPMPLRATIAISQPSSYFGTGINNVVIRNVTHRHRLLFFARDVPSTGNPVTVNTSIMVTGDRANVPTNPPSEPGVYRQQAVDIAKSYYDARLDGRKFGYGTNFITFTNSKVVNNSGGLAMMECDTLVALVMLGIDYDHSPYANETPSYEYDFDNLTINPNNYTWTLPWTYNDVVGRKVTYTGAECWYWWDNARVFSDINQIAKGDVIIFRRDNATPFFDSITHTGIIDIVRENGVDVPYIYHVQGAGPTGSPMSYERLSDVLARRREDINKGEVYFARPAYD